ncbi:ABC transporter ATP-binding protein [Alkalicoccus halolimnae]|uniref:ABC transporter ATP-binding protein n=1 Tax=Alkalicoccus halolimnae TaxID=1667239 RepID=A0A5C7FLH1_9BACI|nr:ABC transporter ATP-binding protein [Alkalicoccus halolimnae]TXF86959.1 ABC transporter ATP-binding protein [Alkalicoccus halolimnae]
MENIISVHELTKSFDGNKSLDGMSFDVKKGEIFGFLGPSGAGKTTTIKILTGQILPTSGEVSVMGKGPKQLNHTSHLKHIGVMTDSSGLYDRLSIYENLKLYTSLYDVPQPKEKIEEVLSLVDLNEELRKPVSKLSKGMTQRVILARALLHEPELLFLDEPTASLDPASQRWIHEGLRQLNQRGTTIFLTTHDMEEAETLCNRVAFLHDGAVKEMEQPRSLRRKYSDNTFTIQLDDGKTYVINQGKSGAGRAASLLETDRVTAVYSNEPTLGDIFVDITGRELI